MGALAALLPTPSHLGGEGAEALSLPWPPRLLVWGRGKRTAGPLPARSEGSAKGGRRGGGRGDGAFSLGWARGGWS